MYRRTECYQGQKGIKSETTEKLKNQKIARPKPLQNNTHIYLK